jgi:hypothetical protein
MISSMLSLDSISHARERPRGVAIIVAVCVSLSAISACFAGLLLAARIPLSAGAFLLGGGMEQLGPAAFLLYGLIVGVLGVALWLRWKGARRTAIAVAAAGIALAVPAISSAVIDGRIFAMLREGLQIIVRMLVIFYLTQEPVKEWFTSR